MMKTNSDIVNPEEQDDFIQSLTLMAMKKMNKNNEFLFQNNGEITPETESESLDLAAIDDYIQKLQLKELKKLFQPDQTKKNVDELGIAEKATITGLDRNVILLLENRKEKATLEQIMIYCKKLHVPFQQFIPELFQSGC